MENTTNLFPDNQDDDKKKKKLPVVDLTGAEDVQESKKELPKVDLSGATEISVPKQQTQQKQPQKQQRVQKVVQEQITPEQWEAQYNSLDVNDPKFKQMDARAKQVEDPDTYSRRTRKKAGDWNDEVDEPAYQKKRFESYKSDAAKLRKAKAEGDTETIAKLEKDVEGGRNSLRNARQTSAADFEKSFGKPPQEGLYGANKAVRLENVGIDGISIQPEVKQAGVSNIIDGFSGKALMDTKSFEGATGSDLRQKAFKKYAGFLGFNEQEQEEINEAAKTIFHGDQSHYVDYADNTSVDTLDKFIDEGRYITDGNNDFVEFEDKNATVSKLGLLVRIAKQETGKADPETIAQYWSKLAEFEKENEDIEKERRDKEALETNSQQSLTDVLSNIWKSTIGQLGINTGQDNTNEIAEKIFNKQAFTTGVSPRGEDSDVGKEKLSEASIENVRKLLAINQYMQNSKDQSRIGELAKREDVRWLMAASLPLYGLIQSVAPEAAKYVPTTTKVGQGIATVAPAFIPYAGLPFTLLQMDAQMKDSDPETYNRMMLVAALTMGAGRAIGKLAPQIGTKAVAGSQLGLGAIQSANNYSVNWANYERVNPDGSKTTDVAALVQDLTIDVLQSGLDVKQFVDGVKTRQPETMVNMVLKTDDGKYAMFFKNPDSGILEALPATEAQVAKWKAAQEEKKAQWIEQTIPKETFDNVIVKNGKEGVVQAFQHLILGVSNPVRDRSEALIASKRPDVKSDVGKAVMDEGGNLSTVKTNVYLGREVNTLDENRAYSALKLIEEYDAPLNMNTNLVGANPAAVKTLRDLADKGILKIDEQGNVTKTKITRFALEKYRTAVDNFAADIESMRSEFGEGKNIDLKGVSEAIKDNGFIGGKADYNYSAEDLSQFGKARKQALAVDVLKGDAEFDPETGAILGKDYVAPKAESAEPVITDVPVPESTVSQKTGTQPKVGQESNKVLHDELAKDYEFRPLNEDEKLSKDDNILIKDTNTGRIIELTKGKHGLYGDERPNSTVKNITLSNLEEKIRSGEYEYGQKKGKFKTYTQEEYDALPPAKQKSVKDEAYSNGRSYLTDKGMAFGAGKTQEEGGYRTRRIIDEPDTLPKENFDNLSEAQKTDFENLFAPKDSQQALPLEEGTTRQFKATNRSMPDIHELARSIKVGDSKTTVDLLHKLVPDFMQNPKKLGEMYDKAKTILGETDHLSMKNDKSMLESNRLSQDDYIKNHIAFLEGKGEVTLTPNLKVNIENWGGTQPKFQNDSQDSSTIAANNSLYKSLSSLMNSDSDGVSGLTVPKSFLARQLRDAIEFNQGTAPEINAFKKVLGSIEDNDSNSVVLLKVNPREEYSTLGEAVHHEITHKVVTNEAGYNLNPRIITEALSGKSGDIIRDAVKAEGFDDNVTVHEVIGYATEKGTLERIGIKTQEQFDAFLDVYKNTLRAYNEIHGDNAVNEIKKLADPKILKAIDDINNYEESKLRTDGRGREIPEGTRRGSSEETSNGKAGLETKTDQKQVWEGSGIKRVSLQRLTPTGEFDSYTNYAAAETKHRKGEGAKKTFNFFVRKPDGQFVYEAEFHNNRALKPFDFDGELNLLDMGQDAQATADYRNMRFADFQKKYEDAGYHGFFSSGKDLPDTYKYRTAVFDNDLTRALLTGDTKALEMKAKERTQSEEFKKWAEADGYQPIKDSNGNVIVLYHGYDITPAIFNSGNVDAYYHGFNTLKPQNYDFVSLATSPKTSEIFITPKPYITSYNNPHNKDVKPVMYPVFAKAKKVWDYQNNTHINDFLEWYKSKRKDYTMDWFEPHPDQLNSLAWNDEKGEINKVSSNKEHEIYKEDDGTYTTSNIKTDHEKKGFKTLESAKKSVEKELILENSDYKIFGKMDYGAMQYILYDSSDNHIATHYSIESAKNYANTDFYSENGDSLPFSQSTDYFEDGMQRGDYEQIEHPEVLEYFREHGFDAFTTYENSYNYHVFNPETQLKGVFAKFEKTDQNNMLAIKAPQNKAGFYSPTEEAFLKNEQKFPKSASGQDFLNKIKGLEGSKKEEIEWMGLDTFLEGKKNVTKDEVRDFIRSNNVVIEEKQYGNVKDSPEVIKLKENLAKTQLLYDNARSIATNKQTEVYSQDKYTNNDKPVNIDARLKEAEAEFQKTEEYKNFAELEKELKFVKDSISKTDFIENSTNWSHGNLILGGNRKNDVEIALQVPNLEKGATGKGSRSAFNPNSTYESPHGFPDNNIVHIRGNERTVVSGKDVFHIDEIQSDLHQAGKKEGYQTRYDEYYNMSKEEMEMLDFDNDGLPPDAPFKDTSWIELGFKKALRYAVEQGKDVITWTTGLQQIDRNSNAIRKQVSKIEYETNKPLTKEELDVIDARHTEILALEKQKRINKFIEGMPTLTDKEQNRLNTLYKERDEFNKIYSPMSSWEKNSGFIKLDITDKNGAIQTHKIKTEGKTMISGQGVTLDTLLGKKMADEIREKGEGVIEGEGLSIGGGLHKFVYDEFLPRYAAKYGKKWGAEVGKEQVNVNNKNSENVGSYGNPKDWTIHEQLSPITGKPTNYLVKSKTGSVIFSESTLKNAEAEIAKYRDPINEELHSMTITPAMKESVEIDGQSLFMKSPVKQQELDVKRTIEPEDVRQDRIMKSYYDTPAERANVTQAKTIIEKGFFSNLSAAKEGMTPTEVAEANANLRKDLEKHGLKVVPVDGVYNGLSEPSFMVYYPREELSKIVQYYSNKYAQESALHGSGGKYALEFADGSRLVSDKLDLTKTEVNETGKSLQQGYAEEVGKTANVAGRPYMNVPDEGLMKELSAAHQQAENSPDAPEVAKAYKALIKETSDQYDYLNKSGIEIEAWTGKGEPYKSSKAMMEDINNNHYYYLPTDTSYGTAENQSIEHPLLTSSGQVDSKGRELVNNDVFRIVHDLMGHTGNKWQFGIKGEWNAFASHAELYSKDALPALISETLMQNSVVADKNYKREGDRYKLYKKPSDIEFADQKAIIPNPELQAKVEAAMVEQGEKAKNFKGDGTYVNLPDGTVKYSIDFESGQQVPAPKDYSVLKPLKPQSDNIVTPEDLRKAWTGEVPVEDAKGQVIDVKAAYNEAGEKVGTVSMDENGIESVKFDDNRESINLINGEGKSGKEVIYKGTTQRSSIGATGMFQELMKNFVPQIEKPKDPSDTEQVSQYRQAKARVLIDNVKGILNSWSVGDPEAFGAKWYSESPNEFAKRVGRNVEDVNNDVVKMWLWLTTAVTSPNTGVEQNAKYAMNAIASIVRFYESGKLEIPKYQMTPDGQVVPKEDGSGKKLGLGGVGLTKIDQLTKGYVPANSMEGFALLDAGGVPEKRDGGMWIKSPTAQAMMDKYGALNGVINFLISPSVDGKKFNKAVDIFSDKVGAFMSNLMGLSQIPTIDTWMNRYLMGLTGDALQITKKNGQVTKIKDMTSNFDPRDGDTFRAVIQKATDEFNKDSGKDITPADTQAIVWTQVKELYNSLTKMESDNMDFVQAYDQIEAKLKRGGQQSLFEDPVLNEELPSAHHNPDLIKDANNKAPLVAKLGTDWARKQGELHYMEQDPDMMLAIKSKSGDKKKTDEIDLSDPKLASGDFDAWVDVASRLVKGSVLTDGEVDKLAALSAAKDIDGLNKFVLGLNKMGVGELFVSFIRVNPLVGVKNIARNTVSNEIHQIANELARIPAFIMDAGLVELNKKLGGENTERSVLSPSFISQSKGIYKALTEGLYNSGKFFLKGGDSASFESPQMFRDRTTGIAIAKPLELYVKYGFRLQEAADIPFKTQAYYRALDEATKLKMKEMGVSFEEAKDNLTISDYDMAYDQALYMSFQDNNKIATTYYKFRDGLSPFMRNLADFTVRYVKTPLNVVSATLDFSGIYPLLKGANNKFKHEDWNGVKDMVTKTLDNPEDRKAISWGLGKGAVGWTLGYIGFRMGMEGMLNSFFDKKEEKKERELQGARGESFGSVQIGGYNVDISSLTPISFYLLSGAAYADAHKKSLEKIEKGKEGDNVFAMGTARILKNLALMTPILSTGLRLYEDNDRIAETGKPDLSSLLGASTFVPAFVGEIAKTKDGKERVIDSKSTGSKVFDTVKSMIPTFEWSKKLGQAMEDTDIYGVAGAGNLIKGREDLPVRYDMLGREIEAPYGFDPLKTKKIKKDDLITELEKHDVAIIDSTKGTAVERNEAKRNKGQYLEPVLRQVILSEKYTTSSDNIQKSMLEDVKAYMTREFKSDKLSSEDENYNISAIITRNKIVDSFTKKSDAFAKEFSITDEKVLKDAAKAKIKSLTMEGIIADLKYNNGVVEKYADGTEKDQVAAFIKDQFNHKLMIGKDLSSVEAKKAMEEFEKSPAEAVVKWYIQQKVYEERTPRLKARREELLKQGKSEAEINRIMAQDRVKTAQRNKANSVNELKVKVDGKFTEKFKDQRQSENVIDNR